MPNLPAAILPATLGGLTRLSTGTLAGTGDDPWLELDLRAPRYRAGFLVLIVTPVDAGFDPRIYVDEGDGFREERSLPLRAGAGRQVYHLPLTRFPSLRRVRFDPASGPCVIRFRALWLRSAITAGVVVFLAGGVGRNAWRLGGLARIIRDAPGFFRWLETPASFYAATRQLSVPEFLVRMAALAAEASPSRSPPPAAAPLISFVSPVYDASPTFLADLVGSFLREAPRGACELILSDDASPSAATWAALTELATAHAGAGVRLVTAAENGGISRATNAGIAAARGAWVSFIDHDDAFAPGGIARILAAIRERPDAAFFYTDEVVTGPDLGPEDVFAKPAYDPVLLTGMNYVNHFAVFRLKWVRMLGGLRPAFDGSQDYDLLLRYLAGVTEADVVHIPYPAYLWRRTGATFSVTHGRRAEMAARAALQERYGADVVPGDGLGLHRVAFAPSPRAVSVVIPNRDSFSLISRVLDGLLRRTEGVEIEVIVVDNGSSDPAVLALYERHAAEGRLRLSLRREPFNFARMCNRGAALARHDLILFLNNDIEIIEPGWLAEMVSCLAFEGTAAVGAKLLYPDRRVQHNGVIVGLGDLAGHWYCGADPHDPGPMARFRVRQSVSAVTAACLLVDRAAFKAVGGFDEIAFPVAYNDVDLCLRLRKAGHRIVWTPHAWLVHHESASRGSDVAPENAARFERDKAALRRRHATDRLQDPAYSPCWGRRAAFPTLVVPGALPAARGNGL